MMGLSMANEFLDEPVPSPRVEKPKPKCTCHDSAPWNNPDCPAWECIIETAELQNVTTKTLTYGDAIRVLADLRGRLEGEHWVQGFMQRAVISGVRMAINELEREAAKP